MRATRWAGNFLLLIGFTFVLFAAYQVVGTAAVANGHQARARDVFERVVRAPTPVRTLPAIEGGPRVVARLRIPRIGLTKIVVEGTGLTQLAYGPGRYRSSVVPGEPGAVAIAGHRTGWGSPFVNLDRLRAGDEIVLQTTTSTFRYAVRKKIVVDPGESWVLGGDPASLASHRLVLTTCTPKYTSLRRLIVWADQVDPPPRALEPVGGRS